MKAKQGYNKYQPTCSRYDKKQLLYIYTKEAYSKAFWSDLNDSEVLALSGLLLIKPINNIILIPTTLPGFNTSYILSCNIFINLFLTFLEDYIAEKGKIVCWLWEWGRRHNWRTRVTTRWYRCGMGLSWTWGRIPRYSLCPSLVRVYRSETICAGDGGLFRRLTSVLIEYPALNIRIVIPLYTVFFL